MDQAARVSRSALDFRCWRVSAAGARYAADDITQSIHSLAIAQERREPMKADLHVTGETEVTNNKADVLHTNNTSACYMYHSMLLVVRRVLQQ